MPSGKSQSLWGYLTEKNPEITVKHSAPKVNTGSKSGAWLWPRQIEPWHEFELQSLEAIYDGSLGRVLQREFTLESFDFIPSLPFREIYDENSFESLLVKWNHSVVSQALDVAQQKLRKQWEGNKIFMVKGGQATVPAPFVQLLKPDWGAIRRAAEDVITLEDEKSLNVLPGETKLSKKWDSSSIKHGIVPEDEILDQWFLPLRQVFTYCVRCNARYGYLITDQELVAVRVKPGSTSDAHTDSQGASIREVDSQESYKEADDTAVGLATKSGILEYRAIPWTHDDDASGQKRGLTVNLALWWLHMMAARENSIALEYEPMYNEKLSPSAPELNASFAISEVRHGLADSSLGEKLTESFQSHMSNESQQQRRKRPKHFGENRNIRQKKKHKASQ